MEFNSIIANPLVGFIGTLLGILSIIVALIIYFRTRRIQVPTWWKRSIKWYDNKSTPHDEIKLTFRGREIPRYAITQLAFWNAGNQTIKKSDFVPASPLRLKIPTNTEVFEIRVTASTAKEICASIASPNSFVAGTFEEIAINFDYLDANDGFLIQVIHDSPSDDDFQFIGKIPGVSEFQKGSDFFSGSAFPYTSIKEKLLMTPFMFGLGGIGVWSVYWSIFKEFHWYQVFGWLMIIYLIIPFVFFAQKNAPYSLYEALSNNEALESKPT